MIISKDPDDIYGDDLVTWIKIEAYIDGVKLNGHIDNKSWAVLMIEKAKEAIQGRYQKKILANPAHIDPPIVAEDINKPYATLLLSIRRNESLSIQGSADNEPFMIELLNAARDALTEYHAQPKSKLIIPGKDAPKPKLII